jgi:hypothetical protein
MTQEQAETVANALLGAAVAGAAYFILRDPRLRRTAFRAARTAIAAAGPWLMAQARQAWAESGASAGGSTQAGGQTTPEERI